MNPVANNPFAETVLNGSLILALPVALLAGLVSFLSPCVLPLVPGYLGYVTGLTGVDLAEQKRGRMFAGVALFVLGFAVIFVLLGGAFGQVFAFLAIPSQQLLVTRWLGVVVVIMGIIFLGGFDFFQRNAKLKAKPPAGLWGAPLLGMTFGLGWAPCIGPTYSAVQLLSLSGGSTAAKGALLAFACSLGLGIPFLLIALAVRRGMGVMKFFRQHKLAIQRLGGLMLIALGLLMISGLWGEWTVQLQTWFQNEVKLPI